MFRHISGHSQFYNSSLKHAEQKNIHIYVSPRETVKSIKNYWGIKMKRYMWIEVLPQLLKILFSYFTSFVVPSCHSIADADSNPKLITSKKLRPHFFNRASHKESIPKQIIATYFNAAFVWGDASIWCVGLLWTISVFSILEVLWITLHVKVNENFALERSM